MRLICSVTPLIYIGARKYESKYGNTNEHTKSIKVLAKNSIMLGKLSIDFLAHYKKTFDKWEGYQEDFYNIEDPDWEVIMDEHKADWVDDIPVNDYLDINKFKDSSKFKESNLFDICMKMRNANDKHLETIEDEEEQLYWKESVERFIDESIHMSYRLTKKMHEYVEEYGEIKKTDGTYDWTEEHQKWIEGRL